MSEDLAAIVAADPQTLSYEQARDGLAEIVNRLEAGDASLEESLRLWECGEGLAKRCDDYLTAAEQRLTEVTGPAQEPAPDVPF